MVIMKLRTPHFGMADDPLRIEVARARHSAWSWRGTPAVMDCMITICHRLVGVIMQSITGRVMQPRQDP